LGRAVRGAGDGGGPAGAVPARTAAHPPRCSCTAGGWRSGWSGSPTGRSTWRGQWRR
jgi:hypothetical protein